mgnify:FL=1
MIDIIIPAYNAHKTIGKTLCSIMLQSRRDLVNVYIVNDCSSTDYQEFVKKYQKYFNIGELNIPQNIGPGGARNYGMKHSKGKIYDEETISKVAPAFSFINFKNTLN